MGASEGQEEELGKALTGASVVVIPAGVPRKPGMTRDDLFNVSTYIVSNSRVAIVRRKTG